MEPPREVDLKHSLWSLEKETWDERAPGLWDWMRERFTSNQDYQRPRTVSTAPRKEIRFGTVHILPERAEVHFSAEWDNNRRFDVMETVTADTFDELMHRIDHLEMDLIRKEHQAERGKKAVKLRSLRCHDCGYPYREKT